MSLDIALIFLHIYNIIIVIYNYSVNTMCIYNNNNIIYII